MVILKIVLWNLCDYYNTNEVFNIAFKIDMKNYNTNEVYTIILKVDMDNNNKNEVYTIILKIGMTYVKSCGIGLTGNYLFSTEKAIM